jgi:hypothetical protein
MNSLSMLALVYILFVVQVEIGVSYEEDTYEEEDTFSLLYKSK